MQTTFPILLIDDDSLLVDILSSAAKQSFPEAVFTQLHSVEEAKTYIENLSGYGPRLILLDLDLESESTGFDLLTYLSTHKPASLIPVIVLTIDEVPHSIQQAYGHGASAFSVKPSSLGEWQAYLNATRHYWFTTITVPNVWFTKRYY